MKAGKLRHPLTIQHRTVTKTASGDASESWATFATSWGGLLPVKGVELRRIAKELWNAQSIEPQITHILQLRYVPGVTADMRVSYRGRTFQIAGPPANVEERDREMVLLCIENL